MKLSINLLVLRCASIEETKKFYELLGFKFCREQHGKGPEHFAAENYGFVLELYPLSASQSPDNIRIGFSTPSMAEISGNLLHTSDVTVIKKPYGFNKQLIMLVQDPDGRKVEISQPLHI
jgi:catechol 2,3-dioxygenase-like lactoylglutathione lyase family enzyme